MALCLSFYIQSFQKDRDPLTSALNLQLHPVASFGIHRQTEYRDVHGRLDHESSPKWPSHRVERQSRQPRGRGGTRSRWAINCHPHTEGCHRPDNYGGNR